MYNIINITEDRNKIFISGEYQKIVCGNTNYYLKFTFDEEWIAVQNKTAIFEVMGKKIIVEFTGDICNIPCMPNASYFILSITCSPNKNQSFCTNSIKFELEKNNINEELQTMDPFISYYSRLKSIVDEIETGTLAVNYASTAGTSLTQVSKNGNETISGNKNFTNRITQNGLDVANIIDISNPNYIINPDMSINQRNKATYSGINTYATDRWKLKNEYSFVKYNLNKTWSVGIQNAIDADERIIISQVIEKYEIFKGQAVTLSFKYKSINEIIPNTTYLSIYDGITRTEIPLNTTTNLTIITKTISTNATTLEVELKTSPESKDVTIEWDWCKLEMGINATTFVPRLYADELALCMRYYQNVNLSGNGCSYSNTTALQCPISLPVSMRAKPSIIIINKPYIVGNSTSFKADDITVKQLYSNLCIVTCLSGITNSFVQNNIYAIYDGEIYLDSELY